MIGYLVKSDRIKFEVIEQIKKLDYENVHIVEIKEFRGTRSALQNRLYWGVWLKEISEHTGYEVDELHEMFKHEFLPQILEQEYKTVFGKSYPVEPSTKKCNTKQFTDYLNRIERFANTEIGMPLSHPEDLWYRAMGHVQ